MTAVICSTLKGGAEQGGAVGQTELAPPPYRPPFRGAVRVEQERPEGGAAEPVGRQAQRATSRVPLAAYVHGQIAPGASLAARVLAPKVFA